MSYTVKSGDNLSLIARANGTTVATLMRLNPDVQDANTIYPGQQIQLPASQPSRETRTMGQVADCSDCSDEYIDLIHQAEEGVFIPITEQEQQQIEREEAFLEQMIRQFYAGLDGAEQDIVAHKAAFMERLMRERVIDESNPAQPFQLTEIRRLAGNRHYAYVRKDSGWRRHRSYSIESQDRARQEGWFDHATGKVDPGKLGETIKKDLKIQFNAPIYQAFVDWCLLEWQSDDAKWTPIEGMPPIISRAEAQAMRFAMGASLSAGYDPKQLTAHIAAKATASASLVEGKAYSEIAWPAEEESEWTIRYRDETNQLQTASLGRFRALARIELAGFAGASAILAANVHVTAENGIPTLRGVGGTQRTGNEAANAEAGAFAGVRADGKVEGTIEWMDMLEDRPTWTTLCSLGVGAGAALGLGAEARVQLKWSARAQSFYFNVHAGVVVGPGASGELGAEVGAGAFLTMLHCVYNALLEVDFRRLEDVDYGAFKQLCAIAMHGLLTGSSIANEAARFGKEVMNEIVPEVTRLVNLHKTSMQREQLAIRLAENILADAGRGTASWLMYAPPEVKGALLDIVCYDYWLTPERIGSIRADKRDRAILLILEASQSWRDFEEVVSRMNSDGSKGSYSENRRRLFKLMDWLPSLEMHLIEYKLKNTVAVSDQPVRVARYVQLTGGQYA
ncbi:LysM peptidoglycan-binding domain-containing protein [Halopseudomonas bauzanensis]|uniref:LysM peptidoglycan-binding domain-containing protein n=1 Tax=Halopseudomonas bauzanensis TaxID=653930 RepID=A0A4U0YIS7_9GAMM|nr:LysM domain-containing protein [Halopseudomonas bauzanensis]TKA91972.1 LysM peptidoglycan-binding domain-containing protein [Halopseudomonas bauzanensis]